MKARQIAASALIGIALIVAFVSGLAIGNMRALKSSWAAYMRINVSLYAKLEAGETAKLKDDLGSLIAGSYREVAHPSLNPLYYAEHQPDPPSRTLTPKVLEEAAAIEAQFAHK